MLVRNLVKVSPKTQEKEEWNRLNDHQSKSKLVNNRYLCPSGGATNENGLTADRPSVPLTFIFLANKPIIQTAGLVLAQDSGIKFSVGRSKATFRRRRRWLGCRMYDDLIMGFLRREGVQDGDLDRTLGADIVGYTNFHPNSCVRG